MVEEHHRKKQKYVVQCEDISDDEMCGAVEHIDGSDKADVRPVSINAKNAILVPPFGENYACYKPPRSNDEMEEMGKKRVSGATKTKILWACRAYNHWVDSHQKMYIG